MFGTFRYVLAIIVLVIHFSGNDAPLGKYAVYTFFTLSGYLMTHILNKVYRENVKGYLINRAIRIYPTYLAVLFLTIAAGALLTDFSLLRYPDRMLVPETFTQWVTSMSILNIRIVPPAWTLKVELFYYASMICLSTSLARVRIWFGISIVFAVLIAIGTASGILNKPTFGNVIASSFPFSFGAWLWWYRKERDLSLSRLGTVSLLFSASLLTAFIPDLRYSVYEWAGLLVTTCFGGLVVMELSHIRFKGVIRSIDNFLGDLSYPIYLSHMVAGSIAIFMFDLKGISMTIGIFIAAHLVSIAIRLGIESPLEGVRQRIRDYRRMEVVTA